MSIDKDKEFDLLVRSMMENAEEEVPSGIWENIAGKLDGNSTPVVLWWRRPLWAVAAAAVLVAGVVATLKLVPSGTTSGNLVADKVEIVSKGETRESPVSLPELEEELVPQSIPSPSRVKAVAKPHSEEVASPALASEAKHLSEDGASPALADAKDLSPMPTAEDASQTVDNQPSDSSASQTVKESVTEEDSAWKNSHDDPFDGERAAVKPSRRPEFGLGGLMHTNGNPATAPGFDIRRAASLTAPTQTQIEQTSKNSSYSVPLTLGVNVLFPIGNRWAIGTGLNWTMLGRTYTGVYTEVSDGEIVRTINSDIHNTLHYIGIPLNVYFRFLDTERVTLYAFAGGSAEKGIVSHSRVAGSSATLNTGISGFQFSVDAGLGVQFNINSTVGIYIDPSLRYWFPSSQPVSIRTQQPLSMGFEAGVRFNL